ncbi:girdin-like isoform X1 [Centropristis striata]|uniref:girdin-like isoform X1 n=1 Tax=Centropristis striata TaxID=184440 RepID=UPI0027DFF050|nr:girdin-like isoform X1 [Centropristis striata]
MDVTEENMTPTEMLEKIAELDYNHTQQRDLNAMMRHWLDVADDDMAMLRSENDALRRQAEVLEKSISEVQHIKEEPCTSLLDDDFKAKRCSEEKIQDFKKETTVMKEQNKKLTAELKSLQQERDQDKINLKKLKAEFHTLERRMEEAQFQLQNRDEVIHQKNMQLKHSKETEEENANFVKYLRLENQELREQLKDQVDEAAFAMVNLNVSVMGEKIGSLSPPLSFAEEIKQLGSSADVNSSMSDAADHRQEETETEELLNPQNLTVELQTKKCAGIFETVSQEAARFLLCVVTLAVLAFAVSGNCSGNFASINDLLGCVGLRLQPYCRVHYVAAPPV